MNNSNNLSKSTIINNLQNIYYTIFMLIFIFVIFMLILNIINCKESFTQVYQQDIYGNLDVVNKYDSSFKEIPIYREPYRWPVGIEKSYPVKHISPL